METIQDFINFLLILIPLAGAARIVYCIAAMAADQDSADTYKRRIRNVVVFVVLAECVSGILKLVASYLGGAVMGLGIF